MEFGFEIMHTKNGMRFALIAHFLVLMNSLCYKGFIIFFCQYSKSILLNVEEQDLNQVALQIYNCNDWFQAIWIVYTKVPLSLQPTHLLFYVPLFICL